MILFSTLVSGNENSEHDVNPIPYAIFIATMYVFICIRILADLTPPNKQSFKVKSEFKYRNHVSDSSTTKAFTIFGGVKVTFFCFKQLPLNIKQKFEFSHHLIYEKRLLSVVVRAVSFFSIDKPFYFHDTTFSVSSSLFKV